MTLRVYERHYRRAESPWPLVSRVAVHCDARGCEAHGPPEADAGPATEWSKGVARAASERAGFVARGGQHFCPAHAAEGT